MGDDRHTGSVPGNATHLHRYELHKRFASRLRRTAGIDEVRAEPSPLRPTRIIARVNGATFGSACPDGDLEIEWRPREEKHDQFRIQFTPDDAPWSCGWHQDRTHDDLGPCHFQIDHRERDHPQRSAARFDDGVPMAVLEACLETLREYGNDPEAILEASE
jgi:hypothetical protein